MEQLRKNLIADGQSESWSNVVVIVQVQGLFSRGCH